MKLVHITDIKIGAPGIDLDVRCEYAAELVARVCDLSVDGGQRNYLNDLDEWWLRYARVTAPLAQFSRVLSIPGNHDQDWPTRAFQRFAAYSGMGDEPYHARHEIGAVDLFLLDLTHRVGDNDERTGAVISHVGAFLPGLPRTRGCAAAVGGAGATPSW